MSSQPGGAAGMRRKAFSLGAVQALVRMACSFISIKFTAVYLGPAGLALVAQFNNFLSLCQGIIVTALETAAIRLGAEYGVQSARWRVLLATVTKVGAVLGLAAALLIAAASPWLASWLLKDAGYAWVFVIGAVGVLATIANAVLMAVLTVGGQIGRVVLSNILATICGVLVFAPAAAHWGVAGGLYASALLSMCSLLISLVIVARSTQFHLADFLGRFDPQEGQRISGFYKLLVFHAVMAPLSLLLIREQVTSQLSLEAAGLWQACWRLSETYTMVITMSATTQYMARLGEAAKSPSRLRAEAFKTMQVSVGATVAMALCIYLAREWIVRFLFSKEFLPVTELMPAQLVGDVVKMVVSSLGYVLVATVRTRWYITTQVATPLLFIGISRLLMPSMGASGVTMAYLVSSVIQCLLIVVALRDIVFLRSAKA